MAALTTALPLALWSPQDMSSSAGRGTFLHIPDSGDLRYAVQCPPAGWDFGALTRACVPLDSTAMGKYYDEFSTPAQPQV